MECWLKHLAVPDLPDLPGGQHSSDNPWTSGAMYNHNVEAMPYKAKTSMTFITIHGNISITLRPELAPSSVRELQRMANSLLKGHCLECHFYRSEANFLVQGVITSPGFYVATPRQPNPPQQSVMERGLVCWAGGFGGPDFFINLVDNAGFGDSHLCWGKITDMAVVDRLAALPLMPKFKPNDMTFILQPVKFNMSLA